MPLVWPSLSWASAAELPFHLVHKSAEGFGGTSLILRPRVQFRFVALFYLILKFIFYFILMNDSTSYLWQSSFLLRSWTWLCNIDAFLCDKAIVGLYYFLSKKSCRENGGCDSGGNIFLKEVSAVLFEHWGCVMHQSLGKRAFFALSFLWWPAVPN